MDLQPLARLKIGAAFFTPPSNSVSMPGFTSISMYPQLWAASGLPYTELIDRLIELALERHADRERSQSIYTGAMPV